MDYLKKNKKELISELQKLKKEFNSLRNSAHGNTQNKSIVNAESLNATLSRLIAENAKDLIFITDLKENCIYASLSYKNLGYNPEELIGTNGLRILHPDDKKHFSLMFKQIIAGIYKVGDSKRFEIRFRNSAGEYYNGESITKLIKDNSGNLCVFSLVRDITKSKQLQQELIEEKRLHQMAEKTAHIGSWEMDLSTGKSKCSDEFFRICGIKPGSMEPATEIGFNITHPEDREKAKKAVSKLIEESIPYDIEKRIIHPDKSVRWIHSVGEIIFDENHKPKKIFGLFLDITEQKALEEKIGISEKKYKSLYTDAPLPYQILFENGSIINVNRVWLDVLGYNRKEVIGKNFGSLLTAKSKALFESKLNLFKNKGWIYNVEFEMYKKDGSIITVKLNGKIFFDNHEKTTQAHCILEDITEIEKAKRNLQESEKKFHLLADYTNDLEYWINEKGDYIYISPSCKRITGYTPNQVINDPKFLYNLVRTDYKEKVQKYYADENKKNTQIFSIEFPIIHKNGNEIWLEHNSNPIFDEHGKYRGRRGNIRDITKRKKSENELKLEQRRLRTLIDNLPDPIYVKDANAQRLIANPADVKNAGAKSEEDVLKKTDMELFPEEIGKRGYSDDLKILKSGIPAIQKEENFNGPNGSQIWKLTTRIPLFNENGETIGLVGISHDITQRKKDELIQNVIYKISTLANTCHNFENVIVEIRQELSKIVDTKNFYVALYDKNTDTFSLPFASDEKDNPSSIQKGKTLTRYVFETKKPLFANIDVKKRLVAEGKLEYFGTKSKIWIGVPLKNEEEVIGVLTVQDFNKEDVYTIYDMKLLEYVSYQIATTIQRKRSIERLEEALKKANESDRLKSTFLASMSHELRTPLNAIIGFSELLDTNLRWDEVEKFGEIINSSGLHLLSIVNDLFDIALIESGESKLKKEDVRIKTVLRDVYSVIENYNSRKDKSGVEFNLEIPYVYEELIIKTDADKLKQILINLLKNAFKFTETGHIKYGYNIKEEQDEIVLLFYVEDSGIGISEDKQELIFDIFRQAEESDTRRFGGTGIGLSVAKRLTELLGGKIWLNSKPEKGSTFYFTIPAEKPEMLPQITITPLENIEKRNNKLILIAEDDDLNYMYSKTILDKIGLKNIRAENGESAVDICMENNNISLILMDINMPVMDGYVATKKIKQIKSELPVIGLTAHALVGDREKIIESGFDDYLSKPFKKEELIRIIKKYLES